jgi:hypothetical protein
VHIDKWDDLDYVDCEMLIMGNRQERRDQRHFPYNLYLNAMLDEIKAPGWWMVLDDDDYLYSDDVIQKVVAKADRNCVNAVNAKWRDGIFPDDFPNVRENFKSFPNSCRFYHTCQKDRARYWDKTHGDFRFDMDIGLPVNWIDVIVQAQQDGPGEGMRGDG